MLPAPPLILSAYITVPLLRPMKGSLGEESVIGIKAGDKVARHQEELIGDQESKESELVLQSGCFWLNALGSMGP